MAAIGGFVESMIINGRGFRVAADAEVQREIGSTSNHSRLYLPT